jgi:hypothetical protein
MSRTQRAMIEAMTAASKLVDQNVQKDLPIIGGAALVRYSSEHKTEDVDIAINAKTLDVFIKKVKTDIQFRQDHAEEWSYTCQGEGIKGLEVNIEFLELGGQVIQKMHGMMKFRDVALAMLTDIVLMKAHAYQDWVKERDLKDMRFTLGLMAEKGETF